MFSNMKSAEKMLLEACKNGKILDLGNESFREKTDDNEIRAEFLKFLILSNNQEIKEKNLKPYILKIDSKGIIFSGVYISGNFDFSFCETNLPFRFTNSKFEKEINISDSKIRFLSLQGSKILSLSAFRLVCQSDIILNNGFESIGKVNFASSQIGSNLECTNGKFINENAEALSCNDLNIEGSVLLNKLIMIGKANFNLVTIGANLNCMESQFENNIGDALTFSGSKIVGNVLLSGGFKAKGNIDFYSAVIGRTFVLNNLWINGDCILISAKIDELDFDVDSLNKIDNFEFDGLQYNHIKTENLNSLKLKKLIQKIPSFKPQPYKQLSKVLRNMGHNKEADDIMIEYNNIITSKTINKFIKILKQIYGFTSGYGYKPTNVLKTMFIIWFVFGTIFWATSKVAVFAPSSPFIFQKKDFYQCHVDINGTSILDIFNWNKYNSDNNWVKNEKLDGEYTTFNAYWYSLDILFPMVNLQMDKDWSQFVPKDGITLNHITRWLVWIEVLLGWIYSLILVAILSGLAKNEKD